MSNIDQIVKEYLFKKSDKVTEFYEDKYVLNGEDGIKNTLQKAFGVKIDNNHFDKVVNNKGKEIEKINKSYSSSLQSLLVFDAVNKNNTIRIGEDTFNEVLFELENPVIEDNHPSSVDVVLFNQEKKTIAFIESKLKEILEGGKRGSCVIPEAYFTSDHGYKYLGLTEDDYKAIGIKREIKDKEGKCKIAPLNEGKYVYSGGIKQILSHLIGIERFKNEKESKIIVDNELSNAFEKIVYIELYNAFPEIGDKVIDAKISDFKTHCNEVKKVVDKKGIVNEFKIMTYQDLYQNHIQYKLNKEIENFYHLGNKE